MKFSARIAAFVCALLILVSSAALAEPRYPDKQGLTTDAAAVLASSTLEDLSTFNQTLKDETGVQLYAATVDFLDGASLTDYAAGLRAKWGLGNDDLLLLMAVGEDKFGLFGGEDVNARLSAAVQQKLLSAYFESSFLAQRYDAAIASLVPALATEIGKAYDETVSVAGLFGQASATAAPATVQDWVDRWAQAYDTATPEATLRDRVTQEDHVSGISLGKVILTVALLMIIFGGSASRRRGGCGCSGCGCAPFSSILAGLGLWNLWGNDRHHGRRGPF